MGSAAFAMLFARAFGWTLAAGMLSCVIPMAALVRGRVPTMSTESNGSRNGDQPKKINLRRPDIMEAVQAQVLSHYRSELVERVRAHGGVLGSHGLTVKLAKEFGFCYGVERAIDLAYAAKKYFSEVAPHTPIYLLGEIIHNPEVNDQIDKMGIKIISPKPTDEELSQLQSGNAVIIPAF